MSGNILEWCFNAYEKPDRIDVAGEARRVVRGGSRYGSLRDALCAYRSYNYSNFRYRNIGFRLSCSPPFF